MVGVALGDIYLRLARQAWHLLHLVARLVAVGRPGRRAALSGRRGTSLAVPGFWKLQVVSGLMELTNSYKLT